MESSQEAYVTIKYRLENKGSEPSWIDIGVRHNNSANERCKSSEPSWIDIGTRLVCSHFVGLHSSEPS